jgi:hypothetical protein
VSIDHTLPLPRWWLRSVPAQEIVGRLFVMAIADKTLQGIKFHAERRAASVA